MKKDQCPGGNWASNRKRGRPLHQELTYITVLPAFTGLPPFDPILQPKDLRIINGISDVQEAIEEKEGHVDHAWCDTQPNKMDVNGLNC